MIGHPNCIGDYPLNYDAADRSVNADNGSLVASPSFGAGVIGNAIILNGSTQYITDGTAKNITTEDFSFFARFKSGFSGDEWIYQKYQSASQGFFDVYLNAPGYLFFRVHNNAANEYVIRTNSTLIDNVWHSICCTAIRATKDHKIYIDGVVQATAVQNNLGNPSGSLTNTGTVCIGDFAPTIHASFNGSLQDVKIFKGLALLDSDVKRLHTGFTPLLRG